MLMVGTFPRGSEGRCHPPAVVILLSREALLFSLPVYLSSFFPSAFIFPISLFHSPLLMISRPSPFILSLLLSSPLPSPYLPVLPFANSSSTRTLSPLAPFFFIGEDRKRVEDTEDESWKVTKGRFIYVNKSLAKE